MTGPLVLGLHPALGWRTADSPRRCFAVLCLVQLIEWPLLSLVPFGDVGMALLAISVGPPAFYSAARVLRPHPTGEAGERLLRHALASASTAFGTAVLVLIVTESNSVGFFLAAPATLGLLVTAPWGVVALVARALGTPVPARARPAAVDGALS